MKEKIFEQRSSYKNQVNSNINLQEINIFCANGSLLLDDIKLMRGNDLPPLIWKQVNFHERWLQKFLQSTNWLSHYALIFKWFLMASCGDFDSMALIIKTLSLDTVMIRYQVLVPSFSLKIRICQQSGQYLTNIMII